DVGAAVIVVIAARIAVVTAVVIGWCADSDAHAERTRVESNLRHCRRSRGRRQKRRRTQSQRKLTHCVPPVVVALKRGNALRCKRVPLRAKTRRGTSMKYI